MKIQKIKDWLFTKNNAQFEFITPAQVKRLKDNFIFITGVPIHIHGRTDTIQYFCDDLIHVMVKVEIKAHYPMPKRISLHKWEINELDSSMSHAKLEDGQLKFHEIFKLQ